MHPNCFGLSLLNFIIVLATFNFTDSTETVTYSDRKCAGDLGNLWLDVVLVVDNSRAVTNINEVVKSILSIFENDTKIGTRSDEPRTTRIGLVTYNLDADIVANLNQFQSFDDLNTSISAHLSTLSSSDDSFLIKGLEAAETVLAISARANERTHYKKVIVIYTPVMDDIFSAYPLADRLKADGITIITVDGSGDEMESARKQNLLSLGLNLSKIATKNYDFSIQDDKSVEKIQEALLQSSWRAARLSCRNQWKNAHLTNEYDVNKHNYVLEALSNSTLFRHPYTYLIGLTYTSGAWYWEQPIGKALKKVEGWSNWNTDFPVSSSTMTVGLNVEAGEAMRTNWQNTDPMRDAHYYVCEVVTCDTDNYFNCFCPNGWTQYRSSYSLTSSYRFGVCIAPTVIPAVWRAARLSCRNQWNNAYLVNEYDANKHNYVLDLLKNTTAFQQPYTYHIGLSFSNGAWNWEQPVGLATKRVQHYEAWNPGFPISSSSLTVALNIQEKRDLVTGWENTDPLKNSQYYVCEVASCDTDNYCDQVDI
ncbi:unnamed protein product [Caenorhabditis sp. 36 PRJEB53466]|nr:unnamed protein product [Caenorhabditis sp. 36 PRJEB53466]